jgi:hypothetical protein
VGQNPIKRGKPVNQPRMNADDADQNRNQGAIAMSTSVRNRASERGVKQPQINTDKMDQKKQS